MSDVAESIYRDRAQELFRAIRLCLENEPPYEMAAAHLAVYSAISYNDAVLIRLTGTRWASQDHNQAPVQTRRACGQRKIPTDGIIHLEKLVHEKSKISYGDRMLAREKALALCKAAERFAKWAEDLLGRRSDKQE
jgi:hypothetical protein